MSTVFCLLVWLSFFLIRYSFAATINSRESITPVPVSAWEVSIGEFISKTERSPNSSSVISELISTFFPPAKPDVFHLLTDQSKRLIDVSLPGFVSLVNDTKDLRAILTSYNTGNKQQRSALLNNILFECEDLYATLLDSPNGNQTFVLGVPLAFVHLSALREKFVKAETAQKEASKKDMYVWLATYSQFIYDGYTNWNKWRMSQLQIDQWVQTTMLQNICHVILSDNLLQRHLVNIQLENCTDPYWMDSPVNTVLTQHFNHLDFKMMAIVSKMFVLHKLFPGYETTGPYAGSLSPILTVGPIQPLSYQIPRNKTLSNSTLFLEQTCQPSGNDRLKGITNIAIWQSDWVEQIQVKYGNASETFGNSPGKAPESMTFSPRNGKCLASVHWRMDTVKNYVSSVTFTTRDGKSVGSPGNKTKTSEIVMSTTAPLQYCITNIAVCTDPVGETGRRSPVTGYKVIFELVNATLGMPEPLLKGLKLTKGSPVFGLLNRNKSFGSNNAQSDGNLMNRWRDAVGYSLPLSHPLSFQTSANSTTASIKNVVKTRSATTTTMSTTTVAMNQYGPWVINTFAPRTRATLRTTTQATAATRKMTHVAHGIFNLPDTIAITADTRRQRDRILENEIKPLWVLTLGRDVSDGLTITVHGDSSFSPALTPDKIRIRQLAYTVDGISHVDLDMDDAADRFHVLAASASLPNLWAVPDTFGNWTLLFPISKQNVTNTTNPQFVPYIQNTTTTTAAPAETTGYLFKIDDVIVVAANTKPQRDRVMEDEVRPLWQNVFGSVGEFELQVKTDSTYSTRVNQKGVSLRQVNYQVVGISPSPLNTNTALDTFREQAKTAEGKNLYAISSRVFKCCKVL